MAEGTTSRAQAAKYSLDILSLTPVPSLGLDFPLERGFNRKFVPLRCGVRRKFNTNLYRLPSNSLLHEGSRRCQVGSGAWCVYHSLLSFDLFF